MHSPKATYKYCSAQVHRSKAYPCSAPLRCNHADNPGSSIDKAGLLQVSSLLWLSVDTVLIKFFRRKVFFFFRKRLGKFGDSVGYHSFFAILIVVSASYWLLYRSSSSLMSWSRCYRGEEGVPMTGGQGGAWYYGSRNSAPLLIAPLNGFYFREFLF